MPHGNAAIRLIGDVPITDNEVFLEKSEGRVLRERHGSQAIRGGSSGAFDVA